MSALEDKLEEIFTHHAETVSLTGDMQMDDEDAVEAIKALVLSEVEAFAERLLKSAPRLMRTENNPQTVWVNHTDLLGIIDAELATMREANL